MHAFRTSRSLSAAHTISTGAGTVRVLVISMANSLVLDVLCAEASPRLRLFERGGELRETFEIMHGKKIVDMRQHCLDAGRPRLEPLVAQQRIEPHQAPTGFMQPFCLRGEPCSTFRVQAIGDLQDDGILAEKAPRPSSVEFLEARADARAA